MNVEAIRKQGKSSKGVLTIKVAKGMLHKLFSFTMALLHDWKMCGAKKENGDIETKLTHCSGPLLSYVLTHDEPTQTNPLHTCIGLSFPMRHSNQARWV